MTDFKTESPGTGDIPRPGAAECVRFAARLVMADRLGYLDNVTVSLNTGGPIDVDSLPEADQFAIEAAGVYAEMYILCVDVAPSAELEDEFARLPENRHFHAVFGRVKRVIFRKLYKIVAMARALQAGESIDL